MRKQQLLALAVMLSILVLQRRISRLKICSKCHPFYTGKQKLVDTGGRVDRFKKRFNLD